MSYTLSDADFSAVAGKSADDRYDYLLDTIVREEKVWILSSDQGMVMMSSDGEQCLPVWPHPDFASEWATGDWEDCSPDSVDLQSWLERWLPGMEADGVTLAVFPAADEETVVVDPREMLELLQERQQG